MKKIILLTAACLQLVFSESHAQMNSSIPLMVQPLQLQNPMQQMQQMEQIRAIQLQNQMLEDQRRAQQLQNQQREEEARRQQSQQVAQPADPIIDEWLKVAAPRMSLYPDFEKVVFASDVSINMDMIRLMTSSPLAADIAYYLGSNKLEALAISKMNLADASKSIDRIEKKLKNKKFAR